MKCLAKYAVCDSINGIKSSRLDSQANWTAKFIVLESYCHRAYAIYSATFTMAPISQI